MQIPGLHLRPVECQTCWHSSSLCLTKLLRSLWHMPVIKNQWYQQQNVIFQAQIGSQLPPEIISHQWFRNASMKAMWQEEEWAGRHLLQVTSKDSAPTSLPLTASQCRSRWTYSLIGQTPFCCPEIGFPTGRLSDNRPDMKDSDRGQPWTTLVPSEPPPLPLTNQADIPQNPEGGKGQGSSSDVHWWWLNQYWSSGDGKARKPRQMFSQIKWFQEKMKACLPRHLVSINLLSRTAAEPSAGTDSQEARNFPHLYVALHTPSKDLASRKERKTLVHLPSRP